MELLWRIEMINGETTNIIIIILFSNNNFYKYKFRSSDNYVLNVMFSVLETGTTCHINVSMNSEDGNNLLWWIQWVGFTDHKTRITAPLLLLRQSASDFLHIQKTGQITQIPTMTGAGPTTFHTSVHITATLLQRHSVMSKLRDCIWAPYTESFTSVSNKKEHFHTYRITLFTICNFKQTLVDIRRAYVMFCNLQL